MDIRGFYWRDAEQGTWQDFLDKGTWNNFTVSDETVTSEVFTLPVKVVEFSCNDTTITEESFSVFASRKDYYAAMTDHLPDYYRESTDVDLFKKMAESELKELGFKNSQIENAIQISNVTTDNIDRMEKEYGLTTDKTLGFIDRKNILLGHYYTILNDSTDANIRAVIEIFGGSDETLTLNPARSLTISLNINVLLIPELTKLMRNWIGAHLGLIITTSDPWNYLLTDGDGTWQNSLDNYTWGSFLQ